LVGTTTRSTGPSGGRKTQTATVWLAARKVQRFSLPCVLQGKHKSAESSSHSAVAVGVRTEVLLMFRHCSQILSELGSWSVMDQCKFQKPASLVASNKRRARTKSEYQMQLERSLCVARKVWKLSRIREEDSGAAPLARSLVRNRDSSVSEAETI
jgi:hypothetical protein